tara:strand:- start:16557 stop:16847 length:291 start_codon:yes stop_codon:yes gene_type:complete
MPDPNKELNKNEKLEQEYYDRIDAIDSSFEKKYDAQNLPIFPNERNKNMVGDQDTFASREKLQNKRVASMNIAKKFSMLDIAYGFGLDFNKHEGGK